MKLSAVINLIIFSIVFFFTGCEVNVNTTDDHHQVHGSGRITTEKRHVGECSGIEVRSAGNIILTQDDSQSILIEADDNIVDDVLCYEDNGILVVGLPEGSYSDITLKIYVSLKSIRSLNIVGAGNINTANSISSSYLNCTINGAGNIRLNGSGNTLNVTVNGAGNIEAKDYKCENCVAEVNGAGNCTVYVSHQLNAAVNGVGAISYYGDPEEVHTSVSGIGRIIKK